MKQKYNPEYYKKNRKRIIANQQRFQASHKKEILDYAREYYNFNKDNQEFREKRKSQHLAWRIKNRDYIRKYAREYYKEHKNDLNFEAHKRTPKAIEKENERQKKRRKTKEYKEWKRRYEASHPEKMHRIIKKNVIHSFSGEEWMQKKKAAKGICPSCKEYVGFNNLTLDHIYPISKANKDFLKTGIKRIYNIEDVQPLCGKCNSSKHDKIIQNEN